MGGKIQISLKARSRRNASQKISLRIKQIGFSMWNTAYATTYVLYNTLSATALTEK